MSTFKKFTAALSALSIVMTTLTVSVAVAATAFTDASNISSWAVDAVNSLVADGVLFGNPDGSFRPKGDLNRAEMAQIAMKAGELTEDTTGAPHFNDVSAASWYYASVETLYNNGVVGGINNGALDANGMATYKPAGTVNRAEAAKILTEALDLETAYAGTPPTFPDVSEGAWYYDFVETAYAHGILDGYANGKFGPADPVNREQVAKIAQQARVEGGLADGTSKRRATYVAGSASGYEQPIGPITQGNGVLSVTLSPNTRASATIPTEANVNVAAWDLTASSADDVKISQIIVSRTGVGNRNEITSLVLKDGEGNRISKAKGGVTSEDNTTFTMLGGGLTIAAGTSKTIVLVVAIDGTGEHRFGIKAETDVKSNAKSISGNFPIYGNTMKVGNAAAGKLTIQEDGNPASVKIGDIGATVAKFKLLNNNVEDIMLNAIILKEIGDADDQQAIENLKLVYAGETIATGVSEDKYVAFKLNTPFKIKKSDTEKFKVTGDIIGEANKKLRYIVEEEVDIDGNGLTYGFGIGVDNTGYNTGVEVLIQAGAVTITKTEPIDKIRKDKKDVVLATLKVTVDAGKDLEFDAFNAEINTTGENVEDILENVEVYDVKNGSIYELALGACAPAAPTCRLANERDLGIILQNGKSYEFQVRADTKNDPLHPIAGTTVQVSFANIGDGNINDGLEFKETADDVRVNDVVPSAITFKKIDGKDSNVAFNKIALSAAYNAVIGTADVPMLEFELSEDDGISDLLVTELTVAETSGSAFNSALVTKVDLYTVNGSAETLVKSKSGGQIANEMITFDDLSVKIPTSGKVKFRVKVSLVHDNNKDGETINLRLYGYSIDDDDSDNVWLAADDGTGGADTKEDGIISNAENAAVANAFTSARTVNVRGTGILYVAIDNTDPATNKDKGALLGATSDFVASVELRGENEDILIKDLRVIVGTGGAGDPPSQVISELILYKNDKTTEIARKVVPSGAQPVNVNFLSLNYVVPQDTSNVYLKAALQPYGKDKVAALGNVAVFKFEATRVEGYSSGNSLVINDGADALGDAEYDSGEIYYEGDPVNAVNFTKTDVSNNLFAVATAITSVELVSSGGSRTIATTLSNGPSNAAIIKITTAATTNNERDGTAIKTYLDDIVVDVAWDNAEASPRAAASPTLTIERINGSNGTAVAGSALPVAPAISGQSTFDVNNVGTGMGVDAELVPGTTAYYLVKANFTALNGENFGYGYIQINLDNLNTGNFKYDDSKGEAGFPAGVYNKLLLDYSSVDGIKITEK